MPAAVSSVEQYLSARQTITASLERGHEPQRQGPHVCGDDMLHLCIDMKPHCRIFAGNVRVCKAVEHTLVHMVVPVVQVEIMEQCPEDQIFIIYMDMQTNGNGTADPHYRKAVL